VSLTTKPQQTRTLTSASAEQIRLLLGVQDVHLKMLLKVFPVTLVAREDKLIVAGEADVVEQVCEVLERLIARLKRQKSLRETEVADELKGVAATFSPAEIPAQSNGIQNIEEEDDEADSDLPPPRSLEISLPISPRSRGQGRYLQAIEEKDLVFCSGPAGSGKTYLAVAMALHCLKTEQVRKIVLVRPAVEAGEKLGFLPGDMLAKVNPFLRPLLDALRDMLDYDQVQRYMEHDVIEIAPLAFMRGRTLNETFMILDEAQNTTITQMKMFLTRMGTGSKIVVTGDETQNDLPAHIPSGLNDAMKRLEGIPGTACVKLDGRDIVRHRLVRQIVKAYEDRKPSEPTQSNPTAPSAEGGTPDE